MSGLDGSPALSLARDMLRDHLGANPVMHRALLDDPALRFTVDVCTVALATLAEELHRQGMSSSATARTVMACWARLLRDDATRSRVEVMELAWSATGEPVERYDWSGLNRVASPLPERFEDGAPS